MPAPLNVNREAVKTLAIAIGVRQAAREMGLRESTVKSWSDRGDWFTDKPKPPHLSGRASNASKSPATALQNTLTRLGEETKHNLAKAGAKASKHFAKLTGARVVRDHSGDFKNIVGASSQLHGWDTRFQGVQFSLNVLNVGELDVNVGES